MAVMRDMMPAFELFQPTSVEDAVELLDRYEERAWILSGGLDTMDWLKDRVKRPEVVVDLGQIASMNGVRDWEGGVEIGAMTTLDALAKDPLVRQRFGLLTTAAGKVATPQIRHQGTLGGNLAQDTRCWYYRSGWPCYRAGGNTCYASAPDAMNREHAVQGMRRCVAVSPTDTGPALIALEAQMVIQNSRGERVVDAEDFFIGPALDITRMTVLEPGDLLTAIRIPSTWSGADFYFEKVQDRNSWDFALVSVARAMRTTGGSIGQVRVAVNGVAPYPVHMDTIERELAGAPLSEATATRGGELAVAQATPLRHNDYKLPMMSNLVKRALRGTEA